MMSQIQTVFNHHFSCFSVCVKEAKIDHMSISMFFYSNILNTQTRRK